MSAPTWPALELAVSRDAVILDPADEEAPMLNAFLEHRIIVSARTVIGGEERAAICPTSPGTAGQFTDEEALELAEPLLREALVRLAEESAP